MTESFPHLTPEGDVHMVDVGAKDVTDRVAIAECVVVLSEATAAMLFSGELPKGDALASARIAGIMGAKRTSDLIPLCHPIPITGLTVDISPDQRGARITATVKTTGKTGVEMEALTAAGVAALSLYDMVKGVERGAEITDLRLVEKSGGRSGTWSRK